MKMNIFKNNNYGAKKFSSPKKERKYKEDDSNSKINNVTPSSKASGIIEEPKKKVGVKAIRKIIRLLNQEISKEEMELMIWVYLDFFNFFYSVFIIIFCNIYSLL